MQGEHKENSVRFAQAHPAKQELTRLRTRPLSAIRPEAMCVSFPELLHDRYWYQYKAANAAKVDLGIKAQDVIVKAERR